MQTAVARSLRLPGYLILGLTAFAPVVEVGLRASPFRLHSPAWRLAFIASGGAAVGAALLAFLLALALAAVAEDRAVAYAISIVSALCAVLCLGASGVFALDAVQMRVQAEPALTNRYDMGSIWVIVRILAEALLFAVLTLAALRRAKAIHSSVDRATVRRAGVLINAPHANEPLNASHANAPPEAAAVVAPPPLREKVD